MKERIIRESVTSLRQEGLRFSVDTLAERLAISKKTVYKYFPNKESLALALYERYYADVTEQARRLAAERSVSARSALLSLYFDAKSMTSSAIFNKYKLNEALRSYVQGQNDALLEILFSSVNSGVSEEDKTSLGVVINGSFEKLCDEKISPDGVINLLVKKIWE